MALQESVARAGCLSVCEIFELPWVILSDPGTKVLRWGLSARLAPVHEESLLSRESCTSGSAIPWLL